MILVWGGEGVAGGGGGNIHIFVLCFKNSVEIMFDWCHLFDWCHATKLVPGATTGNMIGYFMGLRWRI